MELYRNTMNKDYDMVVVAVSKGYKGFYGVYLAKIEKGSIYLRTDGNTTIKMVDMRALKVPRKSKKFTDVEVKQFIVATNTFKELLFLCEAII